jgi:exopolysaccharide biosynthesis predicted pyruvyltransferase EpsI
MRLLPLDQFEPIFLPLQGKKIGYVYVPQRNMGDELIHQATMQLLDEFNIDWVLVEERPQNIDEIIFCGGGNMGDKTPWVQPRNKRKEAIRWGLPITILPQSFNSKEKQEYEKIYIREKESSKYCPKGLLAPDLALGYQFNGKVESQREIGYFLRKDPEGLFGAYQHSQGDPMLLARTLEEYLNLAGKYRHIFTDRLHFAICGLLNGVKVTLLPNTYHKNRSMYETWLKDLDCLWAEKV